MIRCEVYEFLSFLTNLDIEKDLIISAQQVNRLDELLRIEGIVCDFSKHSFELAAYEYPNRFAVDDQVVCIKVQPNNSRKFVYFNSQEEVALKIEEKWEIVKEF